jgi:uroporphyrinogen-III synthase
MKTSRPLADRVVLFVTQHLELTKRLEDAGARVLTCPRLEIHPPETLSALDEAIDNLYGYDWSIFINAHSVSFFLQRFQHQGREIDELDSLKVCAIGELTKTALEGSQIHVDVVPGQLNSAAVIDVLARYLGGLHSLSGLNFLIPQAAIGRDYLKDPLEKAGARADLVATYRTVATSDSSLFRLRTLLTSGGIDCLVIADSSEVYDFAKLFDTNDLDALLRNVAVAGLDEETSETVVRLGAVVAIRPSGQLLPTIPDAIAAYFSG